MEPLDIEARQEAMSPAPKEDVREAHVPGGRAMEIGQLREELKQGVAGGTYLVVGEDALRREEAVRVLEETLCPEPVREWCLVRLDARETNGAEVLDLVSTPPFLGERRVVVVRDADQLPEDDALLSHVANPPAFSTLVLVAAAYDRRRKLYGEIQHHGRLIECQVPSEERERSKRIGEIARAQGVELEPGALAMLMARVGEDLQRAEQEVAKLAVYAAAGARIEAGDVRALVGEGPPTLGQWAVFDYVDALTDGKVSAALDGLGRLLAAGEPPLLVLAMIARQFRLLIAGLAWQGASPETLAQALSMRSTFPAKKAMAQAKGWSLSQLAAALEACAACDASLKRGADGRLALELLTIKLVEMRRAKRRL